MDTAVELTGEERGMICEAIESHIKRLGQKTLINRLGDRIAKQETENYQELLTKLQGTFASGPASNSDGS